MADAVLTKLETMEDISNFQANNTVVAYESPLQTSIMSIMLKKIPLAKNNTLIEKFCSIFKVGERVKTILLHIVNPSDYYTIQPFFPQGYNILSNKGISSTELNSSIFEYIYTNLPFYSPDLEKRYIDLLNGFNQTQNGNKTITVFHGTNFPIHSRDTFKTFAFFSTSLEYSVARTYGKIVYAILVPAGFPYVNLLDRGNKQILLPIATKIRVVASAQNVRFCVVENDYATVTTVIQSLLNTKACKGIEYIDPMGSYLRLPRLNDPKIKGSSRFFKKDNFLIKQSRLCDNQQYTYLRSLNEILACKIYALFGCKTLNLDLVKLDDKYALQSEFLKGISYCLNAGQAKELLRGYIVDCVLANWDVGYYKNVGVHGGKLIRTDVGGALAYRARGEFKISFFNNYDVKEHVTMMSAPLIKQCIKQLPGDEKIDELMYDVFNSYSESINWDMLELESWPEFFIKQVLHQVKNRIQYYNSHKDIVKSEIIEALQKQSGGSHKRVGGGEKEVIPNQDSGSLCGANSIINHILNPPKCVFGGGKIESRGKSQKKMKIISWNINGLRAVLDKNKEGKRGTGEKHVIQELIDEYDPDVLCLQETKCPADFDSKLPFEYSRILASSTRKGYSGVAVFSKIKPLRILDDFPMNEEGRVLVFEFDRLYVLNTYTPNSKPDLSRLEYRTQTWEKEMKAYINSLQKNKPVVYVSDFNVAATEIDIHTAKGHERMHGFTIEERTAYAQLLEECNMIDSWRHQHPGERKYTWYSNFAKARERNKGWRIDGAVVSKSLVEKIKETDILSDYKGSDHVPVYLMLSL